MSRPDVTIKQPVKPETRGQLLSGLFGGYVLPFLGFWFAGWLGFGLYGKAAGAEAVYTGFGLFAVAVAFTAGIVKVTRLLTVGVLRSAAVTIGVIIASVRLIPFCARHELTAVAIAIVAGKCVNRLVVPLQRDAWKRAGEEAKEVAKIRHFHRRYRY